MRFSGVGHDQRPIFEARPDHIWRDPKSDQEVLFLAKQGVSRRKLLRHKVYDWPQFANREKGCGQIVDFHGDFMPDAGGLRHIHQKPQSTHACPAELLCDTLADASELWLRVEDVTTHGERLSEHKDRRNGVLDVLW